MGLIDTHQHLILRETIGYAWADALPALAGRDFTREDYAALASGVTATVFMETGVNDDDYKTEARLVGAMVGTAVGGIPMLGQIASIRPEEDAGFEDWLDEGRALGVVGYRRILHESADELSQGATFRRNLRRIGARGLPFDLCFLARQLPVAEALLAACPDQQFVLDHCGVPDIKGGGFDPWAAGMRRLAQMPHLMVKLSGITAYCAPGQATLEAVAPYVRHVLDVFGPERMLWGGDWPVVDLGAGLPGWIGMTETLLSGLTPEERAAIGSGNARKVYGL